MNTYIVTLNTTRGISGTIQVAASSYEEAIRKAVDSAQSADWPASDDGDVIFVADGNAWVGQIVNDDIVGGIRFPSNRAGIEPVPAIKQALQLLIEARELLKAADAQRSVDRVRLAISSTEGALRHARNKVVRADIAHVTT